MKARVIHFSLVVACVAMMTSGFVNGQAVGTAAPDFTLSTDEGGSFKLSEQKGKVVFIFFFGYACPHCLGNGNNTETGVYNVYKEDSDFVAIGIDTWNGNASGVANFKSSTGLTYPLCYEGSDVESLYGTTYDRMVVIDKEGVIQYKSTVNSTSDIVEAASGVISTLLTDATTSLSTSVTSLTLDAEAGSTASFSITSNTDWNIAGLQSWLSANNTQGSGDASITLTAEENTLTEQRQATLIISGTGVSDRSITVTQIGTADYLTVSETSLSIEAEANSMASVTITANTDWLISGLDSWLSADDTTGTGNATVTFTAEENTSSESRTDTITVSANSVGDITIIISQAGSPTGISNPEDVGIKIYPNPATNTIYIEGLQYKTSGYIFNTSGQLVVSRVIGTENGEINVSQLPSGSYILKLDVGDTIMVKRIHIIK